jgi:signal transduction histidine kinase
VSQNQVARDGPVRVPFWRGLSGRLLLLTMLFVLIGEVLIFVPSIARFRLAYLQERVEAGHIATLALNAAPNGTITPELESRLLDHAMVEAVVLRTPERSSLMLSKDMPPPIDETFDLRLANPQALIMAAFGALADGPDKTIRVLDESRMAPGTVVEVVLGQKDLYRSMLDYSSRILTLSIVLSLLTAGLVYLSLQWMIVRPMRAITDNLTRFRASPEDASSQIAETSRGDEIGAAQKTLREMQRDLRRALLQKTRLAALGAAMSKINHDLRNSLATAMVVSDSLAQSEDPLVQKTVPRLVDAMDRAVALCRRTLNYAQSDAPEVEPAPLSLGKLITEVGEILEMDDHGQVTWINEVPERFEVVGDHLQLFRVFENLGRNAMEAMDAGGIIRLSAHHHGDSVLIDVVDDGPGIPGPARDKLFQPFAGSGRPGGSGLGLAIARETMRFHGGDINLVQTGKEGTHFRLTLPAGKKRR